MSKSTKILDILNDLQFTEKEAKIFLRCIQASKDEQQGKSVENAVDSYRKYIKETVE